MCDRIAGPIGFPAPASTSAFRSGSCGFSPTAVHHSLATAASSSRELCASSSVLRPATCSSPPGKLAPPGDRKAPLSGSSPSSRHQPAASTHYPRFPRPELWSVLGVSHALDGLLRHRPCGFVSPRCHVQGSPFRGLSLSAEPYRLSPADSCPRAVGRTRLRFDPRQQTRPRLQGLAPRDECGVVRNRLSSDRSAPLLGFASLGFSFLAPQERFRAPSAHDLHRDEPTAAGPRRVADARFGLPGIRPPTRSRFPT